jgi:hypothetical protein
MLHPEGKLKIGWMIVVLLLLLYIVFALPIFATFAVSDPFQSSGPYIAADFVLRAILGLDVLITCCTAFYNENEQLVISRKLILLAYLKGWLWVDMVALCPTRQVLRVFNAFGLLTESELWRLGDLLPIVALLKLFKGGRKRNIFHRLIDRLMFNRGTDKQPIV